MPAAPPSEQPANEDRSPIKEAAKLNGSLSSSQSSVRIVNGSSKSSPNTSGPGIFSLPLAERNRESNKNSIIFGSGDITPQRQRFDDELIQSFGEASITSIGNSGPRSTSSSRRGSLSRKSPSAMFDSGMLMECSHMTKRRLSNASNADGRTRLSIGSTENIAMTGTIRPTVSTISIRSNASESENSERKKIMTSFEQLAARQRQESELANRSDNSGIEKYSPDDDENYSYSYYSVDKAQNAPSFIPKGVSVLATGADSKPKYVSESNIQYRAFGLSGGPPSDIEYKAMKRRPCSSGNDTGPFQFDPFFAPEPVKTATTKEYTRFYSTNEDYDDDDDEPKKSSDESSSSPNSKSILNTPVNETIPLLLSSPGMAPEQRMIRTRSDSYGDAAQSPSKIPSTFPTTTSRTITIHSEHHIVDSQSMNEPSHVPVSSHHKSKMRSPAPTIPTSPVSPITPTSRPSRIPLLHNNQKAMSPTLQSPQSPQAQDLNTILPPVEISHSGQLRQKVISPSSHYVSETTRIEYDGHAIRRGSGRKSQQNNGSAGGNTNDMNTIRIKVNQNQRN